MKWILVIVSAIATAEAFIRYCEFPCEDTIDTVCGSNGKTYSNECIMRRDVCKRGEAIVRAYSGACKNDANACYYSCYGAWRSVCGSDRLYYSRKCGLHRNSCKQKKAIVYVKDAKSLDDCYDCNFWCDATDKPVCGHDWKTYSNECVMRREACKRREAIIKVYDGRCKENCNFTCKKISKPVCGDDGKTYSNECVMRREACKKTEIINKFSDGQCIDTRCGFPCAEMDSPICGHDNKTYQSECVMRREACRRKEAIVKAYDGKCKTDAEACYYYCRNIWRPVCANDRLFYSNICVLERATCKHKKALVYVRDAHGFDCWDSKMTCPGNYSPVCGSDGLTYNNECKMRKAAYKKKLAIIQVHGGKCKI